MNTNIKYASPWTRVLAGAINCAISFCVTILILSPLFASQTTEHLLGGILTAVIVLLYLSIGKTFIYSYLITKYGGTPGDLLTGIKVVDETNKNLTFNKSLFRTFIGSTVSGVFLGLGYLYMFADKKRRGWHDIVTGSIVVRVGNFVLGAATLIAITIANVAILANTVTVAINNGQFYKDTATQVMEEIISEENMVPNQKDFPII